MKLTEKEKKLLLILGMLVLSALIYFILYKPLLDQQKALEQEVQNLRAEYDSFKDKIDKQEELELDIKSTRLEIQQRDRLLPTYITQEDQIWILDDIENTVGITFSSLSFTPLQIIADQEEKTNQEDSQTLLGQLAELYQLSHVTEEATPKPSLDQRGIQSTVSTSFEGTYGQLKHFLSYVFSYSQLLGIDTISLSSSNTEDRINCSFSLSFYGFYRSDAVYKPVFQRNASQGKPNIFQPFEKFLEIYDGDFEYLDTELDTNSGGKESETVISPDFFMMAMPMASDLPTVTIGKSKDIYTKTYIYGDNPTMEEVEFVVEKRDGKYYYRYHTSREQYPKENYEAGIPFSPQNDIVLEIFSSKRIDTSDQSGVKANIINHTDKKVRVVMKNDDPSGSRVQISKAEGDIKIISQ